MLSSILSNSLLLPFIIGFTMLVVVGLGTIRTVFLVQGRKKIAFCIGFVESLINILALSNVVSNINQPFCAVGYALGFGLGNYLGVIVEELISAGNQVIRIFTRKAGEVVGTLRAQGYAVTEFEGKGRDGAVNMLLLKVPRRDTRSVVESVSQIDEKCFCIIDDIRFSSHAITRIPKKVPNQPI